MHLSDAVRILRGVDLSRENKETIQDLLYELQKLVLDLIILALGWNMLNPDWMIKLFQLYKLIIDAVISFVEQTLGDAAKSIVDFLKKILGF